MDVDNISWVLPLVFATASLNFTGVASQTTEHTTNTYILTPTPSMTTYRTTMSTETMFTPTTSSSTSTETAFTPTTSTSTSTETTFTPTTSTSTSTETTFMHTTTFTDTTTMLYPTTITNTVTTPDMKTMNTENTTALTTTTTTCTDTPTPTLATTTCTDFSPTTPVSESTTSTESIPRITQCDSPDVTPGGGPFLRYNETTIGSIGAYYCLEGYYIKGDNSTLCMDTGLWQNKTSTCVPVECGDISEPEFGSVSHVDGTTFNNTAVFSCFYGYILEGKSTSTCLETGNWSSKPICKPVDCGIPEYPKHGYPRIQGVTVWLSVRYLCDEGYHLIGNDTIYCLPSGRWSNGPPQCSSTNSSLDTEDTGSDDDLFDDSFSRSLIYGGVAVLVTIVLAVIITTLVLYCRREGVVCVCQIKTARRRQLIQNSFYSGSVELSTSRSNQSEHHDPDVQRMYEEIPQRNKTAAKRHHKSGAALSPLGENEYTVDTETNAYENDREMEEMGEIETSEEHRYEIPIEMRSYGDEPMTESDKYYLHPL